MYFDRVKFAQSLNWICCDDRQMNQLKYFKVLKFISLPYIYEYPFMVKTIPLYVLF